MSPSRWVAKRAGYHVVRRLMPWTLLALGAFATWGVAEAPCAPHCLCTVSQTLSEEIASMDAVVIARLEVLPSDTTRGDWTDMVARAKFKVVQVIKGQSLVEQNSLIDTIY